MQDPHADTKPSKAKQKPSWIQWLSVDDRGLRLLVGIICAIFLALFLHFRETRVDMLELNTLADRYVVAQVDFEFPDEEATTIIKQEALTDISSIYRLEDRQLRQVRFEFENYLVQDREWQEKAPGASIEEMYKIADLLENALTAERFTDAQTLYKMKELDLPVQSYQVFKPKNLSDSVKLPIGFWQEIEQKTFSQDDFSENAIAFVVEYFERQSWRLSEDVDAQNSINKLIKKSIPQKYSKVRAGTRLIDQGEKVTPRYLAMQKAMKEELDRNRHRWEPLTVVSSIFLSLIFVALSAFYFYVHQPEIVKSLHKLSLVVSIVVLTLIIAKVIEYLFLTNSSAFIDTLRYPLIVPFATILICILLKARTALYIACFLSIILSVTLAVEHGRFLVINLVASLVVITTTRALRKRKEVFGVCAKAWLSTIPILFAFSFGENILWSKHLGYDFVNTFVFMFATAICVVGLLPVLESLFHVMTDMSLVEFMDPNNELLRRLTLEIPGTYQHCLVLGNIAEAAAQAIGANGLLCRVSTLYHDIGKLNNPHFFTENQQSGVNIHQLLTPQESAQVIISHVKDGEVLARKYRLPQSFIDIIKEHHGTTLVYYFYCKEVELKGGNIDEVDESLFRYPGPKPRSKEAVIVMIADTIEAASRSLEDVTEESLTDMVDRLVSDKAEDGQFDECCLTFEELGIVKKTIVKTLMMSHHVRVKYPAKRNS